MAGIFGDWEPTGFAQARCRACKSVTRRETQWRHDQPTTCACGSRIVLRAVWGKKGTKPCDARCMNAVGPSCECQCEGRNHGRGFAS